jgi:hypothetical protein
MTTSVALDEIPISPRTWNQLGVLVGDASYSMTLPFTEPDEPIADLLPSRSKAAAVDGATKDVLNRIRASRHAANVAIGFVYFNSDVSERRPPQDVLDIATSGSFDPTAKGTGDTWIHTGIDAATQMVLTYLQSRQHGELPVSATVVVVSDGDDADPGLTVAAAKRLKALPNTVVTACLFATEGGPVGDGELLRALATGRTRYRTVYSTRQLSAFFHASLTMTAGSPEIAA